MAVVCGTDFSEGAEDAHRVAAAFARALGAPLVLVHVVDLGALGWAAAELATRFEETAGHKLAEVAAVLARDGLEVQTRVLVGDPDEKLAEVALESEAQLAVVGVLGHRSAARWRVGSLAARLARAAPVPVLLVADAAPFELCARGERPLRVLVAADLSVSGDVAAGWLATLRRLGACDALLLHLYDPTREWSRLGLRGQAGVDGDPAVEEVVLRDLQARIGELPGPGRSEVRVAPVIGWVAESLALVAERERFDVILVGGRRRSGLARIRHDSVSEGLLRLAPTAVLRVPVAAAEPQAEAIPILGTVLAPTDLSPLANQAVRYAYALASPSGTVVLLHVVEETQVPNPLYAHYGRSRRTSAEQRVAEEREIEAALRALVPAEAEARGIETRIELVRGQGPAEAIRAAAERTGADAVCMATHGRSGLSRVLAGSVAQEVAASSRRPLFLVRSRNDD